MQIAKKTGEVRWSDIEKDMYYLENVSLKQSVLMQSSEARAKFAGMTVKQYLRYLWNAPRMGQSPYHLFERVLKPNGIDENGDIIYKYNEDVTYEPCKRIDRKEINELRV